MSDRVLVTAFVIALVLWAFVFLGVFIVDALREPESAFRTAVGTSILAFILCVAVEVSFLGIAWLSGWRG